MTRPSNPIIWLLIGYMWLFVHRPFEIWPWLGALRVERVYMLVTIGYWLTTSPAVARWNRLHTFFALFMMVFTASWLVSPYQAAGREGFENYWKYAVFCVLLVTSVRDTRDLRWIVTGYLGVMFVFMAHSMNEAFNGRIMWSSMGVHRMMGVGVTFSHPNDFAGLIAMSLPFAYPLWREANTRSKQLAVLAFVGLSLWCIVRTNSRMGLCGALLGGLLWVLASRKRWRLLALAPVLFVAGWMVLPQETKDRYVTLIDPDSGNAAARASSAHYRSSGFFKGLDLLEQYPLLGCGPGGSTVAFGGHKSLHNTYGQLLAELGALGVLTFALVLLGVVLNTLEARRLVGFLEPGSDLLPYRTVMASSAAFLLTVLMGWGLHFLLWHVWLWFGAFQVLGLTCLQQQVARARDESLFDEQYAYLESEAVIG